MKKLHLPKVLLVFTFTVYAISILGQVNPPENDDCINAIVLLEYDCDTTYSATLVGADADPGIDPLSCNFYFPADYNPVTNDVWFKFEAQVSNHILELSSITNADDFIDIQLFEGSACSSLDHLDCVFDESPGGGTQIIPLSGLVVNSMYYLRISSFLGDDVDFNICLTDSSNPNDDCENAIPLIVDNTGNCDQWTTVNFLEATQNQNINAVCNFSPDVIDQDIWLRFTADHHAMLLITDLDQATDRIVFEVFSGTCGSLSSLEVCHDNPDNYFVIPGLDIGQSYFVSVGLKSGTPFNDDFNICLSSFFPINDDCSNASVLHETDALCSITTIGDVTGATISGVSPSCGSLDYDIWFKFTAKQPDYLLKFLKFENNLNSNPGTFLYQLFSSSCSSIMTPLICRSLSVEEQLSGLTIGTTYFLRTAFSGGAKVHDTFEICLSKVVGCNLVVSDQNTLYNAVACAEAGDVITFNNSMNGSTMEILDPIICTKAITIQASANQNIIFSNADPNNNNSLLLISAPVVLQGIDVVGKSEESMIITLQGEGSLDLFDGIIDKASVDISG